MRKIILTLLFFMSIITAQTDSLEYLNYYPLHIGDRWVYELIIDCFERLDTTYIVEEVISDTILSNNKRYFKKNDGFFYSIDTTTYKIYKYSKKYDEEYLLFDLSPFDNEIDSTFISDSTLILIIRSHNIGNAGYIMGTFEKIQYNLIWGYYGDCTEFTKGIGVSRYDFYEICGTQKILIGTEIDGVVYGNISGIMSDISKPSKFRLYPNYPNPFNVSTKILYEISETDNVTINVFDMLGNLKETLVSYSQEPGQYTISWDASKYSSGIYIIQMNVSKFMQSEKCIFLK